MDETLGQALLHDARIAKAKQLMLEALRDKQASITGIKPANQSLVKNYEEMIEEFSKYRGGKLWFPYLGSGIGNGTLVELLDGSIKYDFISGIGPHYLGHSHAKLIDEVLSSALNDTVMEGHLQQNADALDITRLLVKASGMSHCFLSSSGAMANENALKLAFHKKYPATRILAFDHCFMGRSLASSQITDKPSFREKLPHNLFIDYLPFYDPNRPEESTNEAVHALKRHLVRYPHQHAVLCVEVVQGEGGFNVGSTEFFRACASICKDAGIAILIDEIQTFGRTYELFGYHYFGLQDLADIVTIGKLSQVCATLFTSDFAPGPGLLSQTFTASTSAIRAGKFMVQTLLEGGYFGSDGKIAKLHQHFARHLEAIRGRHPELIHGPWGIGSMIAFTPFDGSYDKAAAFIKELFKAGVIGFIAGTHPTRVRFLIPAGVVTTTDIDNVAKIVEETLVRMAP